MTQLLQRWGIEVHAAANEDEALRLARADTQVRLIIADYNLTSRTGVEVVRELRKAFGAET
ncbi:response regulator, partial [Klebsiella aerogenes]